MVHSRVLMLVVTPAVPLCLQASPSNPLLVRNPRQLESCLRSLSELSVANPSFSILNAPLRRLRFVRVLEAIRHIRRCFGRRCNAFVLVELCVCGLRVACNLGRHRSATPNTSPMGSRLRFVRTRAFAEKVPRPDRAHILQAFARQLADRQR